MEFYKIGNIYLNFIFVLFLSRVHAQDSTAPTLSAIQSIDALKAAEETLLSFNQMFTGCITLNMPHKQFLIDNVHKFVNYPSKTTIGLGTKFTENRKFFANMITTTAFKKIILKDEEEIWNNLIEKVKYCDEVVMDQELLKDFYTREIDQSIL